MRHYSKKLIWVIVFTMITICTVTVYADETGAFAYKEEAQKLHDLGIYKGISDNTFEPDMGTALDRETGVVMLLRLFGLEAEAEKLEDADTILSRFTDSSAVSPWAKKTVAYAVKNGLLQGNTASTIGPKAVLSGKAYCTLVLRQLGYSPDYDNAPEELADKGGLTKAEAMKFTNKELIKDDLAGISFKVLSVPDSNGKKVIDSLIDAGAVSRDKAVKADLIAEVMPQAEELDIKSALPLNDKLVEVSLNTAAQTDLTAGSITVHSIDGDIIAVSKLEFAGWDANNKTLLVTLETGTTAGKAYTLASGNKATTFGGKGADTGKPKVIKVYSAGNKNVIVEFNTPVKVDGGVYSIVDKNGDKLPLGITGASYKKKNIIILSTEEQKETSVYSITIESVSDFSGNVMEKDADNIFAGTRKVQNTLEITNVKAIDFNKAVIEFNYELDEATISAGLFTITEKSGSNSQIPVLNTEKASKEDSYAGTDDSAARSVIVNIDGSYKIAFIYKVEVGGGIMGLYGKGLSTDQDKLTKVFGGIGKPVSYLEYASPATTTEYSTSLIVKYKREVEKGLAENTANYTIAESSSSENPLEVIAAVLQPNGTDVKLTVAPMRSILYKLTVKGITDIYGNTIKEENGSNSLPFAGISPAGKISEIKSIVRISGSVIRVEFNKNIGSNAADVSLYSIDNGIGCPEAIVLTDSSVANYKAKVDIIVPETVSGRVYTLTVRGLSNLDGVSMDNSDAIKAVFGGMQAD